MVSDHLKAAAVVVCAACALILYVLALALAPVSTSAIVGTLIVAIVYSAALDTVKRNRKRKLRNGPTG